MTENLFFFHSVLETNKTYQFKIPELKNFVLIISEKINKITFEKINRIKVIEFYRSPFFCHIGYCAHLLMYKKVQNDVNDTSKSTFTVRNNIYYYHEIKKNQSTNKKTSCYYYESFSLSFDAVVISARAACCFFLRHEDQRVSPRPIASPSARVSGNLWSAVSGKKDTRNLWKKQKKAPTKTLGLMVRVAMLYLAKQWDGKWYQNCNTTSIQKQIALRIVGYNFSFRLTATLNLCLIYLKSLVHVVLQYGQCSCDFNVNQTKLQGVCQTSVRKKSGTPRF